MNDSKFIPKPQILFGETAECLRLILKIMGKMFPPFLHNQLLCPLILSVSV